MIINKPSKYPITDLIIPKKKKKTITDGAYPIQSTINFIKPGQLSSLLV